MKVALKIGLLEQAPGWVLLLKQLGCSFEVVSDWNTLSPDRYSIIICNSRLNSHKAEQIENYLKKGGAVLDGGCFLEFVDPGKLSTKKVHYLIPEEDDPLFKDIWLIDVVGTIKTHTAAQHISKTVLLDSFSGGFIGFIGVNINLLMTDTRKGRKQFYCPSGKFPNEIVSLVSKSEIRKVVEIILKWLHFQRKIPYLHWWYFPDASKNIFALRIDSDFGSKEQVNTWYHVARKHQIKMTWFLHTEAHKGWLPYFNNLADQEFAIHGNKHHIYNSYNENYENIESSIRCLEDANIPYKGFAAPFGNWNDEIAKAVEEKNLEYSSEFALDYDNFPFLPWLDNQFGRTLQIPIHPICIGSFRRTQNDASEIKAYYRFIIEKKIQQFEPLIFYDHLLHQNLDVLKDIFSAINELGIENLTFGEYSGWWNHRLRSDYQAFFKGNKLHIEKAVDHKSVHVCLWKSFKNFALLSKNGWYNINQINWQNAPKAKVQRPEDISTIRRFNPKLIHYSLLDSYWQSRR